MRIDEDKVADLLRRLDDEPTRPPRVDLAGAIGEARRRRRNRRATAAGAAALGVLAVAVLPVALNGVDRAAPAPATSTGPSTPSPKPRPSGPWQGVCTAALLPGSEEAAGSEVTAGDPDGRWLVGRLTMHDFRDYRLLIWEGNRVREIAIPGEDQQLRDVNRAGLAVGATGRSLKLSQPWAVRDGEAIRLPGVSSGSAAAVNDAGRIVGFRNEEDGREVWTQQRPVIWDSPEAPAVDLPLPGPGWAGSAIDIDEDGTILARMADMTDAADGRQPQRAVIWRPGATRPEVLPLPQLPGGTTVDFMPLSLAGGWVTGMAYREKQPGKPGSARQEYLARIDLRTGKADLLPAVVLAGTGNARGWQAGTISGTGNGTAVVTDTKLVRLPGLDGTTASGDGWVKSLSDDGRVLGGQLFQNERGHAVRWTCR
ncbi:hypothetical protein [Micromonospora sp. WP24]|uniref:hypothetical protein n=1 Tax=Micromonospora sp. WP24 TaxID=2604469 RepID=UPI0011DDAF84|nr:hypothetical protein [Micromonospora sp. WP24]